jgi:hypothetical protein
MNKTYSIKHRIAKIFISTSHREPDLTLAKKFAKELQKLGHKVFLAKNNIAIGEEWQERLNKELNCCDYMLLLLSKNSAESEMVYEEVKQIKERQNNSNNPVILPIRVNLSYDVNYDLSKQLENIHQLDWESSQDTLEIVQKVSNCISNNSSFGISKNRIMITPTNQPMPNAPLILEQPTGTVALDSRYYVEREGDRKCYQNLNTRYTLIRIKAPRQYGKTSLLARIILEAKEQKLQVVSFNFQEFNKFILEDLDKLLNYTCKIIAYKLKIKVDLDEMMLEMFTSKMRATIYMEEILSALDKPFVLAIDEVDRLFEYDDVSNEFFGLIRAWHEKSKTEPLWEKMKIVLSHSTEPLLGINDLNQSPFHNVGLGIELKPFTENEIVELSLRDNITLGENLKKFMKLLGGHPYLSRLVLYTMVEEKKSFDNILNNAYSANSIFLDHINRYIWIINRNPKLKTTIKELLENSRCSDDHSCYTLEATGLIRNRFNKPEFACELYQVFFTKLII